MKSLSQHIAESLSEEVQTNTVTESNSENNENQVNESEEDNEKEEQENSKFTETQNLSLITEVCVVICEKKILPPNLISLLINF